MKKTLIALAALAGAGVVSAQSSVTLFGVVDLGYENVKTGGGRISGIAPSANSSSRIGFRGTEDLGGGMAASFWLESALNPASGFGSSGTSTQNQSTDIAAGGLTFNRRSTISLTSSFGELRVGRDYTPSFWNYTIFDPFGTNSVGAIISAYTGSGSAVTFVRASNSIGYFLPANLGGIYGQAMYAFGNRNDSTTQTVAGYGTSNLKDNGRYFGGRLGYAQGPINTAIAYARTKYAPGTNTSTIMGLAGVPTGNFTDLNWGGSYQFGMVKAMATYTRQKLADVAAPGVSATTKGWSLGADVGVGAGDILAEYSQVKLSDSDARAKKFSLGYVHNLSKRTAVYAIVAHVKNDGGSALTASSYSSGALAAPGTFATNSNVGSTGYDIGIRHSF